MYASIKYWVWLADLLPTAVGHRVYQFFNSPIEAFLAEPERYDLIPGLTRQQKELLCHASLDRADSILEECARKEIRVVTWQDADYPERLRSMPAPPLVVYAQGRPCHFDDEAAIAIAGTRRASPYGRRMAQDIASELTQMGSLVVTGIVAGCDLSAARGALETGQPLVCVLAGGVDVPYYQSESGKRLLAEIAEQGTLVSLSPPGTPHLGGLFRSRNELLVGLSLGVVCVEAGQRSGTLQVARMAMEQGRPVYVVPANVGSPSSAGTNELLRQNLAVPILRGAHVLEDFYAQFPNRLHPAPRSQRHRSAPKPPPAPPANSASLQDKGTEKKVDSASQPVYIDFHTRKNQFTDDEIALLTALQQGYESMDDLIAHSGVPVDRAISTITLLSLRGFVDNPTSSYFTLTDQAKELE